MLPTASPSHRRRNTIIAGIAIVLVVLALVVFLVGRVFGVANIVEGHSFHDALGLFSASIPNGWNVTGGIDTPGAPTVSDPATGEPSGVD